MDVNVDEQAILDKLYESTKDWVSVEVELNKTMKPSVLFHLTEKDAGDRFYMRLNDNYSSYFDIMLFIGLKTTLRISNPFLGTGKN